MDVVNMCVAMCGRKAERHCNYCDRSFCLTCSVVHEDTPCWSTRYIPEWR